MAIAAKCSCKRFGYQIHEVPWLLAHGWLEFRVEHERFASRYQRRCTVGLNKQRFHGVLPDDLVVGNKHQGFRHRLGNEHPIERVAMVLRQISDSMGVLPCYRKSFEVLFGKHCME